MNRSIVRVSRTLKIWLASGVLLGASIVAAGTIDASLAGWIGREITIDSSSVADQFPIGGKLTFIYDGSDDVVRICTRTGPNQRKPWRMDLASGCNTTLIFTRGTRYCTVEDVKAGDGETLSACHRLRSRDVALKPPTTTTTTKGAVELQDVIVFLVEAEQGKHAIAILVDTPSRVTAEGVIIGKE
jgi:hypothetical protein